jgi:hypothetical protein
MMVATLRWLRDLAGDGNGVGATVADDLCSNWQLPALPKLDLATAKGRASAIAIGAVLGCMWAYQAFLRVNVCAGV